MKTLTRIIGTGLLVAGIGGLAHTFASPYLYDSLKKTEVVDQFYDLDRKLYFTSPGKGCDFLRETDDCLKQAEAGVSGAEKYLHDARQMSDLLKSNDNKHTIESYDNSKSHLLYFQLFSMCSSIALGTIGLLQLQKSCKKKD